MENARKILVWVVSIALYCSRRSVLRAVAFGGWGIFAAPLVEGCGFHPLYARRDNGGTTELARIRIDPIGDRIGQVLRNALLDRMTPNGVPTVPRYVLSVKLNLSTQYLNFRKDNTASRADLRVLAAYKLQNFRRTEPSVLFKNTIYAVASYDVLDAPYATVVAEQEAQQRVAHRLAEEILDSVAVYLLGSAPVAHDSTRMVAPRVTGQP